MIRNRMKEHRARLGLKQEELAMLVGVRRETIGNLEKGRYNPSLVLAGFSALWGREPSSVSVKKTGVYTEQLCSFE